MDAELDDETWAREQVTRVLGPDRADAWLQKPNRHLNDRSPLQLLRSGEGERVRNYVTALLNGNFP